MMYEKELNSKSLTDGVELICVDKGRYWKPRKGLVLRKFGEEKRVGFSFNRNFTVALKDGVTNDNVEEAIRNGDAIRFNQEEMIKICKEIGYFTPVSKDSIRNTVDWFVHGRGEDYEYGMEWGDKIKEILTEEEKELFRKWENLVGYKDIEDKLASKLFGEDITYRKYNCEDSELESALYVVMHSQRLLNSAIYLHSYGLDERHLSFVWNYLLCYNHKSSFKEVMYFSDWDKNDPDDLIEKYGIVDEIVEQDVQGIFQSQSATLRKGKDYKLAMQITTSIDDWDGIAVVVPIDCELSPLEIVSAGESIHWIESSPYVENQMVI